MARTEWLRTFLAVYRAGSITEGARDRALSQPAASQQLAGLERSIGAPLFLRHPAGVEPTARGRELYGEIADALDQLESVMGGLDRGVVTVRPGLIRIGATAEYFAIEALPRLARLGEPVSARFANDGELLRLVAEGELDVAVVAANPGRRTISTTQIGVKQFVLVASPLLVAPGTFSSLAELGAWLDRRPWVAYSHELPTTRRFWRDVLHRSFSGELKLVAPDLRAVLNAVVEGMGVSILPTFICAAALATGEIVELHPVSAHIPAEPLYVCARTDRLERPRIAAAIAALGSA